MAMHGRLNAEKAEEIAISALVFLAGRPDSLGRFLSVSGIGPADLRAAAGEAGFLVGVLEFFLADESLLLAFAEEIAIRPTMIAAARFTLDASHEIE